MRSYRFCALILTIILLTAGVTVRAEDSAPQWPSAEAVLDRLKSTLDWYQQARQTTQMAKEAAVVLAAREDEQAVLRIVQHGFAAARAQAALVEQATTRSAAPTAATNPATRRAERRAKLETAIREGERELERLRERVRHAPAARRAVLERELTALTNRLALDRMQLELLTSLQQAETSLASGDADLSQQIQTLQETVPEALATSAASPKPAAAAPTAAQAAAAAHVAAAAASPAPDGTWTATHRLLALQRARSSLKQLVERTEALAADVKRDEERSREGLRELSRRLRAATGATGANGTVAMAEDDFRRELEKLKLMGAARVPLRAEAALLERFQGDLRGWLRTVDRESRRGLQELAVGLAGVVIGLGVIGVGAIGWRIAVTRYVRDPYRRRLLLRVRSIAVGGAVVLLLIFHFTSELTALVTALGFAAAGIAFALQNVILSMAGYFSMMAPNGIRVGDRVSLQGPFGYVHGEVIEIGLVRLRLRELTADPLEPTGRIVVFPNSVVFTGSFYKLPPPQANAA